MTQVTRFRKTRKKRHLRCRYCGKRLNRGTFTADHIHPKSRGGTSRRENLCVSCKQCNTLKGDSTIREFKGLLNRMLLGEIKRNGIPKASKIIYCQTILERI
jgi:5-methylcytosine-specific restriction endonuclease McrA